MKYLGIDYGVRKIGLATSDNGLLARPLMTIENRGDKKNIATICGVVDGGTTLVLGLPYGAVADEIRRFGAMLSQNGLNVVYQDEGFSSFEGREIIENLNNDPSGTFKKSRYLVDVYSATVILQRYIDGRNGQISNK